MPTRIELDAIVTPLLTQQGSGDFITGAEIREARGHDMDYVDQQDAAVTAAAAADATAKANAAQAAAIAAAATDATTKANARQAPLVSGTNIKTINGATILGSGDMVISGGGATGPYEEITGTIVDVQKGYKTLTGATVMTVDPDIIDAVVGFFNDSGTATLNLEGEDLTLDAAPGSLTVVSIQYINGAYHFYPQTGIISASGDTQAPTVVSRTATTATNIRIVFSEVVTATNIGHSFKKNGSALVASAISGSGTNTLDFTVPTMLSTDTILASYNSATGDTMDAATNELVSYTDAAVTNSIGDTVDPTVLSMEAIDANTIEVVTDEDVDITDETGWSFENGAPLTISGVTGTGTSLLTFTIVENMDAADTITGSYDEPTGNTEDAAGNRLQSFTGDPVTNSITGGGAIPITALNSQNVTIGAGTDYGSSVVKSGGTPGTYDGWLLSNETFVDSDELIMQVNNIATGNGEIVVAFTADNTGGGGTDAGMIVFESGQIFATGAGGVQIAMVGTPIPTGYYVKMVALNAGVEYYFSADGMSWGTVVYTSAVGITNGWRCAVYIDKVGQALNNFAKQ